MRREQDSEHTLRILKAVAEPRARLVCLPYAGAAASLFHAWSPALPADVELRAVQLPGRQDRRHEPAMTRMDAIINHLVGAVAALPPVPTALFGHSFGALVAFELARRLHAAGTPPFCLIASGRRAPHLPLAHPPLHALPDAELLTALNRYCHTRWDLLHDRELMDLVLPALRADFEAFETFTYAARSLLDVPTMVLRGKRDGTVSLESAFAWGEVISRELDVYEVDAGHFFMDTHRAWVLQHVNDALCAAPPVGRAGDGRLIAS